MTEKELSAAQKEKMDVDPDNPPEGPGAEDGDGDIDKKDLEKLREESSNTTNTDWWNKSLYEALKKKWIK